MRIATLEPGLSELVCHYDLAASLVAVSHDSDRPDALQDVKKVTSAKEFAPSERLNPDEAFIAKHLSRHDVDLKALLSAQPDIILTCMQDESFDGLVDKKPPRLKELEAALQRQAGYEVKLCSYHPSRFDDLLSYFEEVAQDLSVSEKGRSLAQRVKAQSMDWCDNFYDRMKNKRVTFVSDLVCGTSPNSPLTALQLAGYWVPDMIQLASGFSQERISGKAPREVKWQEIIDFRPDVMLVAPQGLDLKEALATFKVMEKLPRWEEVLAVKRGEVFFCPGLHNFYRASPSITDSMAILISVMAGFDSGYITPRDSFFRLRWLEMQRHKIT